MRPCVADVDGFVGSDGAKVHYEVYGRGEPTILLLPTWSLVHSRQWKQQVPYLSRHFRVVCFDGRGSGLSDRPVDPAAYSDVEFASDALAVMDATGTQQAILGAVSAGALWALRLGAEHPDRVLGSIFIGPAVPLAGRLKERSAQRFDEFIDHPVGWEKYNARHWLDHYPDFVDFFVGRIFTEPHSTKQIEDAIGWALETDGRTLVSSDQGLATCTRTTIAALAARVRCPVLVIHGSDDAVNAYGRGVALVERTGGTLVTLEGSGHFPHTRDPVKVDRLVKDFVDRIHGTPARMLVWTRGSNRPKRVLYLSSPVGLGHVRRDVAVAKELRQLRPELEIDWLAQHPVTAVLEAEGEHIHPASQWLANESAHITSEASGHDLHCFQALRRMDEILLANFMVFQEVVEEGCYDLIIGDEAWEVDYFWHENPELKRGQHVWMTDFVGYLPMPEGGDREAFLTTDYNAEMIEHIAQHPRVRDGAIFVGNRDDIVADAFGPELPGIRDWTEQHFSFSGYITGFIPPAPEEVASIRSELGYRADEQVCMVAVGGSGVGGALLEKVVAAYPLARKKLPALRMVVVAGPRIDPTTLPGHPGLEVRGFVNRLYRHLSVCDLAIVQGGLTTTMELTAAKRPFLYFPLGGHFEQNFHVRHRLERYGAGQSMDFDNSDPDLIAATIAEHIGTTAAYRDVETDGAARAAGLISEFV
jgi:pimeloyl-ACP methyl ester carboxylesterase/predicted glycosyltransferase